MIGEYGNILQSLTSVVGTHGFVLSRDEDFVATLVHPDGARICLEGDRASYPAFSIVITPMGSVHDQEGYALWLLMEAWSGALPAERRKPSLANQLWFLENFQHRLFRDEDSYREAYRRLNTLEF